MESWVKLFPNSDGIVLFLERTNTEIGSHQPEEIVVIASWFDPENTT